MQPRPPPSSSGGFQAPSRGCLENRQLSVLTPQLSLVSSPAARWPLQWGQDKDVALGTETLGKRGDHSDTSNIINVLPYNPIRSRASASICISVRARALFFFFCSLDGSN